MKTFAQCDPCFSISGLPSSIGPLCPGSTYTFTPTPSGVSYNSYCGAAPPQYAWSGGGVTFSSTNTLSTVITVPTVSTTCTLTVTSLCSNIVCDPSFESGYFNSCDQRVAGDYGGPACPLAEANVNIVSLPSSCGFSSTCDFTAYSGSNMYIVNGNCGSGAGCSGFMNDFYASNVNVCYDKWYYFSMWVRLVGNSSTAARPNITVYVGSGTSTPIASATIGPAGMCDPNWVKVEGCWHSLTSGTVLLHMQDATMIKIGNDFAIDDINLQPYLSQSYPVSISVPTPPTESITYSFPVGCSDPCPSTVITYTITGTSTDLVEYYTQMPGASYSGPYTGYPPISFSMTGGGVEGDVCVKVTKVTKSGCEFPMLLETCIPVKWPTAALSTGLACIGQPFTIHFTGSALATLNVTPAVGSVVLDGSGIADVPLTLSSSTPVTYCITSINNGCCLYAPGSPIACMTVNPAPVPSISLTSDTVCVGEVLTLSVYCPTCITPYGYEWGPTGSFTTSHTPVSITTNTVTALPGTNVYSVSGTNTYGCTGTDVLSVVTPPAPVVSLTVTPSTTICHDIGPARYLTFDGTDGATVYYNANGTAQTPITLTTITTSVSITPSVTTTYSVTAIISAEGCPATATIPPVTVYIITEPTTCISGPTTTCTSPLGNSIIFTGVPYSIVYFYVNGCSSDIFNITLDLSGLYYLDGYLIDGVVDDPTSACSAGTHLPCSSIACLGYPSTLVLSAIVLTGVDVPSPDGSYCHFIPNCDLSWKTTGGASVGTSIKIDKNNLPHLKNNDKNISLMPNPNNGSFIISGKIAGADESLKIAVIDLFGKIVYNDIAVIKGEELHYNISLPDNIANGIYFIKLKNNENNTVIKFAIDR